MYRTVLGDSRRCISFHPATEHKTSRVPHLETESDASSHTPFVENTAAGYNQPLSEHGPLYNRSFWQENRTLPRNDYMFLSKDSICFKPR